MNSSAEISNNKEGSTQKDEFQEYLQEARINLENQQYDDALSILEKALEVCR